MLSTTEGNIFLPSRTSLINLLRRVPFHTGINESILKLIKAAVDSMAPKDRYCQIMFDEMALEPSLAFNTRKDIIIGFQDNGDEQTSNLLADKAMVFMARGICRKWKQVIEYYLNEGGMKKDILAVKIKEIVRAARSIGLKIVAIICGQASANISAIKQLYCETEQIYRRNKLENRNFGFEMTAKK